MFALSWLPLVSAAVRGLSILPLTAYLASCNSLPASEAEFGRPSVSAIDVRRPLPEMLTKSDAAMIASAAFSDQDGDPSRTTDWINPRTGSSGTVGGEEVAQSAGKMCRRFDSTVTSFSGVRQYLGVLCDKDVVLTLRANSSPEV